MSFFKPKRAGEITESDLPQTVKNKLNKIGDLSQLQTKNKSSLTAATNEVSEQLADIVINVKSFGAKGDGKTDDTIAIQSAINFAKEMNAGRIEFGHNKTYIISIGKIEHNVVYNDSEQIALNIPSNITLDLNGSTLHLAPNNQPEHYILYIEYSNDVTIMNGTITGDRHDHLGTGGEWGHGISIVGDCNNIIIDKITSKDNWGDGIEVSCAYRFNETLNRNKSIDGGVNRLFLKDCIFDNNRRQGVSIIAGKNITIENCQFKNTHGTAPQFGIDLEPNYFEEEEISDVYIRNCLFDSNEGGGIIAMQRIGENLTIESCIFKNQKVGFGITAVKNVVINNCKFLDIAGLGHSEMSFSLVGTTDVIISNNIFKRCDSGIAIRTDEYLSHNIKTPSRIKIHSNIFDFIGTVVAGTSAIKTNGSIEDLLFDSNTVVGNKIHSAIEIYSDYISISNNIKIINNKISLINGRAGLFNYVDALELYNNRVYSEINSQIDAYGFTSSNVSNFIATGNTFKNISTPFDFKGDVDCLIDKNLFESAGSIAFYCIIETGDNNVLTLRDNIFSDDTRYILHSNIWGLVVRDYYPEDVLAIYKGGTLSNKINSETYVNRLIDEGKFNVGDILKYVSLTTSNSLGIVCVSSGLANNTPWASNTSYLEGSKVFADNKVYECTVAGISGTHPPSHTDGIMIDGNITWRYMDNLAIFREYGTIQ